MQRPAGFQTHPSKQATHVLVTSDTSHLGDDIRFISDAKPVSLDANLPALLDAAPQARDRRVELAKGIRHVAWRGVRSSSRQISRWLDIVGNFTRDLTGRPTPTAAAAPRAKLQRYFSYPRGRGAPAWEILVSVVFRVRRGRR